MFRNGRPLRRTVLIGMGVAGTAACVPWVGQARAGEKPQSTPIPTEPSAPQNDAAQPQRAVLYEEDAHTPNGRRFAGSTRWSVGRETAETDASRSAPDMVLRAKVVVPERRFGLQWAMRRNADKKLPATHTVELKFELPPHYQHGEIQSVPGILAKTDETARGMPIAGLAVKVKSGYFLIGLSAVETESQRNVMLLKERSWLDLPIVYADGKRAILAVEKGPSGERAFDAAFAAWEAGG